MMKCFATLAACVFLMGASSCKTRETDSDSKEIAGKVIGQEKPDGSFEHNVRVLWSYRFQESINDFLCWYQVDIKEDEIRSLARNPVSDLPKLDAIFARSGKWTDYFLDNRILIEKTRKFRNRTEAVNSILFNPLAAIFIARFSSCVTWTSTRRRLSKRKARDRGSSPSSIRPPPSSSTSRAPWDRFTATVSRVTRAAVPSRRTPS